MAVGLALSLLGLGLACRDLLRSPPGGASVESVSGEVEHWFFEPSESASTVVLAILAWLLWRRRRQLAALWGRRASGAVTGGLWLAGAGVFAWAVRSGAPDLQALALIPILLGAVNLLGGSAAMRVVALPVAILVFAVPLPSPLLNEVLWRLQLATAEYTGALLHLLGVPARISSDVLVTGKGLFVIIESCSGMRSIETLTLLAVLLIDLFERRGWRAVAVFVAAPFVAFAVNGLRALGLIFNPHSDIATIHNLQGILMLLGGVLVLYAWDGALERLSSTRGTLASQERRLRRYRSPRVPLAARVVGLVAFSALLVALSFLPRFTLSLAAVPPLGDTIDRALVGWHATPIETDRTYLGRTVFRQMVHRRYVRDGDEVDVFAAEATFSIRQSSYRSPKTAFPDHGWQVEREERGELAGTDVVLRVMRKGNRRVLSAHGYPGAPGLAVESLRSLLALDSGPFRRRRVPLVVRLSTPLPDDTPVARRSAERRLERFGEQLAPAFRRLGVAGPRGPTAASRTARPGSDH